MNRQPTSGSGHGRHHPTAFRWGVVAVLLLIVAGFAPEAFAGRAAATGHGNPADHDAPVVRTDHGAVRGAAGDGVQEFRGIPYAAPPLSALRWKPPRPAARWRGVRDATRFSPACPQGPDSPNGQSEDCLYLNVTAPAARPSAIHRTGSRPAAASPVIVWLHGGGYAIGEGADYDPAQLAAGGAVVVTVNYRLGALGFLAHPALASRPGGPAGNYGLMDQQAALRWVRDNIRSFGGDPHRVTIAGQSAGGLAVLAHLVSPGSRGLFQRAIVQSGAFAPRQQTLRQGEADGRAFADAAGCPDQSAACLRSLPVETLVANAQGSYTPGIVDGSVLPESVGSAIAAGRFHRVPIVNGSNHEEERIFTNLRINVANGATIALPSWPLTSATYESTIASTLQLSARTAARVADAYPVEDYGSPALAFSALSSDANFSCPSLTLDRAASRWVPVFGYGFDDDTAPERFVPDALGPPYVATHQSELQYLFGLPNALPATLDGDQLRLASTMRTAWTRFAASGTPSSRHQTWPRFDGSGTMLRLLSPSPQVDRSFAQRHRCGLWESIR